MKKLISGALTDRFRGASQAQQSKPKKKRPAPLSIRLNDDERALLIELAGTKPLATYVKACVFNGRKPRRARTNTAVQDFDMLARLLAALGQTDAFRNLDVLVQKAEDGSLDLSDETTQAILTACACITDMRNNLMQALGLRAG